MVNVSPLWKYSLISDVTVVVFLKSLGSDFAIEAFDVLYLSVLGEKRESIGVVGRLRFVDPKVACDHPFGNHRMHGEEFSEFTDSALTERQHQMVD